MDMHGCHWNDRWRQQEEFLGIQMCPACIQPNAAKLIG